MVCWSIEDCIKGVLFSCFSTVHSDHCAIKVFLFHQDFLTLCKWRFSTVEIERNLTFLLTSCDVQDLLRLHERYHSREPIHPAYLLCRKYLGSFLPHFAFLLECLLRTILFGCSLEFFFPEVKDELYRLLHCWPVLIFYAAFLEILREEEDLFLHFIDLLSEVSVNFGYATSINVG